MVNFATEIAQGSDYKQRHGAVLYKRGRIISIGYNKKKTHPKTVPFYKWRYLHAEFDSILKVDVEEVEGASIACVRINRAGDLMPSRPCCECIKMLSFYGVIDMVYSSRNGIGKEIIQGKQ